MLKTYQGRGRLLLNTCFANAQMATRDSLRVRLELSSFELGRQPFYTSCLHCLHQQCFFLQCTETYAAEQRGSDCKRQQFYLYSKRALMCV